MLVVDETRLNSLGIHFTLLYLRLRLQTNAYLRTTVETKESSSSILIWSTYIVDSFVPSAAVPTVQASYLSSRSSRKLVCCWYSAETE